MTETVVATARWHRLDQPGDEVCRLIDTGTGWRLAGEVRFGPPGDVTELDYDVACGRDWATIGATVAGTTEERPIDIRIARSTQGWRMNGTPCPALDAAVDVDLFFTPATNLLPIRRLALAEGGSARVTAAWLTPDFAFEPLVQTYTREAGGIYRYGSPEHGFSARLTVHRSGLVTDYPPFWAGEVSDG